MQYRFGCLGAVLLVALASPVEAQVTIPDEYGRHIGQAKEIAASTDAFGDRIDLNSGGLDIVQTDVEIPGNGAPPVRLGRRYRPSDMYGTGSFNRWDLDIPHLHGTFTKAGFMSGWTGWSTDVGKRCSQFSAPSAAVYQGGSWDPDDFWSGSFFYLPGSGDQELLLRGNAPVPADGLSYPVVTKEGAAVRCVTLATTSESGSEGEGFEVVTPDGMVYTLNQMVSRIERTLVRSTSGPVGLTGGTHTKTIVVTPTLAANFVLPRKEIFLYPTKVEDRFGNVVTYVWSTTNPWQLLRIEATDGRHLDLSYQSASNSNWVSAVSDGSRTWTYSYNLAGGVDTLTLPDGSAWSYRLNALSGAASRAQNVMCDTFNAFASPYVGSVTSPSGAVLELTMATVKFGRSWVPRECSQNGDGSTYAVEPYLFVSPAVTRKKITGPGLPTAGLLWTYSYGAPNHCWINVPAGSPAEAVACTVLSPTTRDVSVTNPDGLVVRHIFGNMYGKTEGQLLHVHTGWTGASALRSVAITYADPEAAPYAAFNGYSVRNMGDYDITRLKRPQRQVVTTQQGRTFTWEVAAGCNGNPFCFDAFARPTKVVKSSSP